MRCSDARLKWQRLASQLYKYGARWSPLLPMHDPRWGCACAAVGECVIVAGSVGSTTAEVYEEGLVRWRRLPCSLPHDTQLDVSADLFNATSCARHCEGYYMLETYTISLVKFCSCEVVYGHVIGSGDISVSVVCKTTPLWTCRELVCMECDSTCLGFDVLCGRIS